MEMIDFFLYAFMGIAYIGVAILVFAQLIFLRLRARYTHSRARFVCFLSVIGFLMIAFGVWNFDLLHGWMIPKGVLVIISAICVFYAGGALIEAGKHLPHASKEHELVASQLFRSDYNEYLRMMINIEKHGIRPGELLSNFFLQKKDSSDRSAPAFDASNRSSESRDSQSSNLGIEAQPHAKLFDRYQKSHTAIKYLQEASDAWRRVEKLPPELQEEFLRLGDEDPRMNWLDAADSFEERHRMSMLPFASNEHNEAWKEALELGDIFAKEYLNAVRTLGEDLDPNDLLLKVKSHLRRRIS